MAGMEFNAIFDILDPASKGYISIKEVHQFMESINFNEIDIQHVRCAVQRVNRGSSESEVKKENFMQVLQETSRRVQVEEMVQWDFRAMDSNGSHLISIQDALSLFKNTHGEQFSMKTWKSFMASRNDSIQSVCFDEIRMWLCDLPEGPESGVNEMKTELERLDDLQNRNTTDDYREFQSSVPEMVVANRKEEHEMNIKRGARRKFNKWEKEGVRSVLYDDGIDRGEDVSERTSASVSINDLLDRLDIKYRMLRTKLFWNMIHKQSGVLLLSDSEQVDAFQQLELHEKQLRREGTLEQSAKNLPGAMVSHPLQLIGLIGGLRSQLEQLSGELSERRMELRNSGRDEQEVELTLRNEFELRIKGPVSSADMLINLQNRWQKERDELIQRLRSNQSTTKTNQAVLEFGRLERQYNSLELEEEFHAAASSTGIAERPQKAKYKRFNPDRVQQERLATYRLSQRKGRKLKLPSDADKVMQGTHVTDLMAGVIKEMSWRQAQEREVLIQLLLGRDSAAAKAAARQLNGPQRHHKVTSLRNQRLGWRNSSAQYRTTHKIQQIKILQDGVGLYYENIRSTTGTSDNVTSSSVLADLQQAQDEEFENLLNSLPGKKGKELENMIKAERASRKEEQLDTLARVVLGVFEMTEDEKPIIDALDAKYDALRHVLLLHALRAEHGLTWQRLKDDEKQRLLVKRQNEEQRLRHDGRFTEMGQIISAISEDIGGNLRKLMGENRQEFYQRQALYAEKKDHAIVQGLDVDPAINDELPEEQTKTANYLADLLQRYYVEQNVLMGWIRSSECKAKSQSHQQLPLVLLKLETKISAREDNFEVAAMAVGLMERIEAANEIRHLSDQNRQHKLSALRTEARKQRVEIGEPHQKELDEYARPEKGNHVAWMESFIWEQNKKHVEERELLLGILQDPGLEELMEVARTMAPSDRSTRLAELRTKRNKMNIDNIMEREENYSIIEEAAAIRCVIKREHLAAIRADVSHKDVTIDLLRELQDEQDREAATFINKVADMTEEELKKGREYEINSRHWQAGENVIHVLTRHEGEAEDDALLKALEEKYDAMRDKLLIEALMKQYGEAEWKRFTEKERQQKLVQLKLREKQLRRDGKLDELAKLLGESLARDEALRKMMGESRAQYERRLQEKLARRLKRIDEGLDPDEDDEELDEEDVTDGGNPLVDLQARYEEEKEALLRRMRGLDNAYLSEKERQAQLLRLKREKRKAEREDKFDNAARLLGLAERQHGELSERLKNDRLRHEQLAKERLEALKKKRGLTYSEDVLRNGTQTELQDAVMKRLDDRHAQERQLFVQFLSSLDSDPDTRLFAQASSSLERQEQLQKLCDKRQASLDSAQENHVILQEACSYKVEIRRDAITAAREGEVEDDDISVSLLADLQQRQEKEAEEMLEEITEKGTSDLVNIQVKIIEETKEQRCENVATVIFAEEKDEQNALMAALDSKYDALREKLLIEALMAQVGENEWKSLSEEERQKRLAEMKLKERQLRRAGKYSEAENLFGDAIRNHEALQDLMGENRLEQERKLKERLERRQQRKAKGMSDEECDKLEQEEIEVEEEEAKKKRNVLLDLMKNYDAEKDAIMRALQDSESKADRERRRQLEMARLKREERRTKSEAKYDAAAIVLGLAQKQKETMDAERLRQEQLAKERLAHRRAARQAGLSQNESDEEVPVPVNKGDIIALQDAVLREVELKHNSERELLLQVMEGDINLEAVKNLNVERQIERLEELRQLRALWRSQSDGDAKEQMEYVTDGIGLCMENKKRNLDAEGKSQSQEAVQVALLADLQQYQEQETRAISNQLAQADSDSLLEVKEVESLSRKNQWYDNMAKVVFGADSDPEMEDGLSQEEKEVVRALEKKYDAARDKLLIEALMKEAGDREWAILSKQEKHKRLVKLRLEEKQLRRDGKYNEAAALLGQLAKDQAALNEKLGVSRSDQQKRLEEQLKRRAEMKAEREAKGMSTDETLINAMVDQEMAKEEEKKSNRHNVLENLDHHYEDEKEALLAALRGQEDRHSAERQRQLQLAKLRRDQKMMDKEDKFDSAAIILSMAEKGDKKREENFASERERQRQLAKERLAARRQKKTEEDQEQKDAERLKHAEEKLKAALDATSNDMNAGVLLQDDLLEEIEAKQTRERDAFMDLLKELENDKTATTTARKLGEEESRMQLEQYRLDRTRWQKESRKAYMRLGEGDSVTETEKDTIRNSIEEGRNDQKKVLLSALAIRMEMEVASQKKLTPNESEAALRAEAGLSLLTELQIKQHAEVSAVENIIPNKDDQMLTKLKDAQHMSKIYGWFENLNSTVFTLPTSMEELSQENGDQPENKEKLEKELEEELEKEKDEYKKKLLASGSDVDVEAALKELEEQQAAKRKALQDAMNKQQKQLKERLDARRRAQEAADYEEETAIALVRNAEREHSFVLDKKQKEKNRQQDLMQQRLAARRDARRKDQQEETLYRDSSDVMSDTSSRANTPSLPGGRMRREKTALDVEVSEDQKKELFSQVVREHADWTRKISADQQRQQEVLQRRLRNRTNKRQEEVEAVFSLGQRQKTILEKTKQEERDRQITAMKERVARVRYERTMTMMTSSDKQAQKFDQLLSEQSSERLTEDEKMSLAAKKMQEKFQQEERSGAMKPTTEEGNGEEGDAGAAKSGSEGNKILSREDKMAVLKQRRLEKKRQRQEAGNE